MDKPAPPYIGLGPMVATIDNVRLIESPEYEAIGELRRILKKRAAPDYKGIANPRMRLKRGFKG